MAWIERHWQRVTPLAILLYPLALMFRLGVAARRLLYRVGLLARTRLKVPVIVIGNINVGGTGKTPLVLWTIEYLAGRGLRPGIVSRGYGRRLEVAQAVTPESDPAEVGDEPVMLARRTEVPVWVGNDRAAAASALLAAHPDCAVIVCDDGLQHYRLARDVEVAVIDGERGLGSGWLLPAGPLREPHARLAEVDAIVVNGGGWTDVPRGAPAVFPMHMRGGTFRNLLNPDHCVGAEYFAGKAVHAVAGIGNPQRFFRHLQGLGLDFIAHAYPDHHPYRTSDLAYSGAGAIVMTEKDAVKCGGFAAEHWWALVVDAELDPAFGSLLLRGIKKGRVDG